MSEQKTVLVIDDDRDFVAAIEALGSAPTTTRPVRRPGYGVASLASATRSIIGIGSSRCGTRKSPSRMASHDSVISAVEVVGWTAMTRTRPRRRT